MWSLAAFRTATSYILQAVYVLHLLYTMEGSHFAFGYVVVFASDSSLHEVSFVQVWFQERRINGIAPVFDGWAR